MSHREHVARKMLCHVKIQTETPLRIASGNDDGVTDILLLKTKQGVPFIPATSLMGVLRARLEDIYGTQACQVLFGSSHAGHTAGKQSLVIASDIPLSQTKVILRDGVKIDSITGTAVPGAKFDFEALDRGATGVLRLEVTLRNYHLEDTHKPAITFMHAAYEETQDVYGDMMATICDLLTYGISLGALTTKGFGLVKSTTPATLFDLPFTNEQAAESWLRYVVAQQQQEQPEEVELRTVLNTKPSYTGQEALPSALSQQQCIVDMDLRIKSALLIREMREENYTEEQKQAKLAAVQLKSQGDYMIPGTSIKGVLRHHAERILENLCQGNTKQIQNMVDALMGYSTNETSFKSRLTTHDAYIDPKAVHAGKHSRNRIDRFTGGTIEGALFSDEPIWQDKRDIYPVHFRFHIRNCDAKDMGLLLLLIRDIWVGTIAFGGNKNIGRGVLQGQSCQIQYDGKTHRIEGETGTLVEGDETLLNSYVQALVGECHG